MERTAFEWAHGNQGENHVRLKGKLTAIAVSAATFAFMNAASAWGYDYGTGHSISGTCYESGDWYASATLRTKTAGDSTRIKFSSVPTNGIQFRIIDDISEKIHGTVTASAPGTWLALANGDAPREFVNEYRLLSSGSQSNYSFAADEQY